MLLSIPLIACSASANPCCSLPHFFSSLLLSSSANSRCSYLIINSLESLSASLVILPISSLSPSSTYSEGRRLTVILGLSVDMRLQFSLRYLSRRGFLWVWGSECCWRLSCRVSLELYLSMMSCTEVFGARVFWGRWRGLLRQLLNIKVIKYSRREGS